MWGELLDSIGNDGKVGVLNDQVVAIFCLLETDTLQKGKTSVNFGYTRLHCGIVQVHLPELLILRVFLYILQECCHGLTAKFSNSRCSHISIQCFNSLDRVFYDLSWRLHILLLLFFPLSGRTPKSLTLVTFKDFSHLCLLSSRFCLRSLLCFNAPRKLLIISDSFRSC